MCNDCSVNELVRTTCRLNKYVYRTKFQCPACQVPDSYDVSGLDTIVACMVTYAKSRFTLFDNELSTIFSSFCSHRTKLEKILNSPTGIEFDRSQCQTIRGYVDFIYQYIGSDFDTTDLYDRMKQMKVSARWIKDYDSLEATGLLSKVCDKRNIFFGFTELLMDLAVRCWESMSFSMVGNPRLTYRFHSKLESIVRSRERDRTNVDDYVIDLTVSDENGS